MNFKRRYELGQLGKNIGLSMGIPKLTSSTRGIQKKMIYAVGAAPKVGKSKFVNFAFILSPYKEALKKGPEALANLHWIFYSFEMDRSSTEFHFAAHYFAEDYDIHNFMHKGEIIMMSADYLLGKLIDKEGEMIPLHPEHQPILIEIYKNRIKPLFGTYDEEGKQLSKGKIDFIEERDNPTGLRNYIMRYAKENGEFQFESYYTVDEKGKRVRKERIVGYKEKNPDLVTIIITDHMRKLKFERGFSMKQNVDKWVEYQVEFRNWCLFTFVDIIHTNRSVSAVERMKFAGEFIYPTGDDLKDTGNLSEDANMVITLFNANDEKYGLEKHFGYDLASYPYYRSIHIVESRDTECPLHIMANLYGGTNIYAQI